MLIFLILSAFKACGVPPKYEATFLIIFLFTFKAQVWKYAGYGIVTPCLHLNFQQVIRCAKSSYVLVHFIIFHELFPSVFPLMGYSRLYFVGFILLKEIEIDKR